MTTLSTFLDQLVVGKPRQYRGLVVFPILLISNDFQRSPEDVSVIGNGKHNPDIHIFETGSMDKVRAHNIGKSRALLLQGATIKGGAGNRAIVSSVLLEREEEREIPARSVEERRWECVRVPNGSVFIKANNPKFNSSAIVPGSLKNAMMTEFIPKLQGDSEMRLDQVNIWTHIAKMFRKRNIKTDNLDLHNLYDHFNYILEIYENEFPVDERQIGLITFLNKKTWFVDVFLNNGLLKKSFHKLIASYAIDIIDPEKDENEMAAPRNVPNIDNATDIIAHIKNKKLAKYKVFGQESDQFFLCTPQTCGTALIKEEKLFYLTCCSRESVVA